MRHLLVAAAIAFSLTSTTALAGNVVLNISGVGSFPDGTAFILLSSPVPAAESSCGDRGQVRFSLSTAGGVEMYRTALAAFVAGRSLTVNIANSNSCFGTFPLASYLFVQ
ncbi:MAG: hypothetical protein JNJ54_21555 [Myxococcaceae bacterium]|nr:hypothetical protein [Myxococcaceae bacterium]